METKEKLLKVANGRLHPSLTHHSYLVLRRRSELISGWLKRVEGDALRVLEVGGRYQPYRPLVQHRARQYVALDILQSPLVDVVGNGESLPFRSGIFDLVIATGVLEYFPEPKRPLQEIHSVLKPGGFVIASVAAIAPRAVDEEHWRFLPAGLRYVFSDFAEVEIVPEASSVASFFRYLNWSLSIFCRYEPVRRVFHYTAVPCINLLGLGLERLAKSHNDNMTGNYSVIARKALV
jgi:SAM-dependent methyltransferase